METVLVVQYKRNFSYISKQEIKNCAARKQRRNSYTYYTQSYKYCSHMSHNCWEKCSNSICFSHILNIQSASKYCQTIKSQDYTYSQVVIFLCLQQVFKISAHFLKINHIEIRRRFCYFYSVQIKVTFNNLINDWLFMITYNLVTKTHTKVAR